MHNYFLAALCAAAIGLVGAGVTRAHEGHDHGDAPKAPPTNAASRAEATTEQFELVAVARGQTLELYLHDAATNAPIGDARIELETPAGPARPIAGADQVYRLLAPFLAKAGQVDLVATVSRGQATDVLPLSLTSRGDEAGANAAPEADAVAVTATEAAVPIKSLRRDRSRALGFCIGLFRCAGAGDLKDERLQARNVPRVGINWFF
jgi:hypothetical protein